MPKPAGIRRGRPRAAEDFGHGRITRLGGVRTSTDVRVSVVVRPAIREGRAMLNDHEVRARLAAARLVTVGRPVPGARGLARRVHEVDLSGLDDPRLVPHAVIRALGVSVRPDLAPLDAIAAGLRGPALLVLGPCDRVLAGCAQTVAGLLERCPDLSVLAISGVPLGVPGEIPVN